MPRPKKPGAAAGEAKKRSRTGCWQCKARKIKCGEEKPSCQNCVKSGDSEACDYRIRLNWNGRRKDNADFTLVSEPSPTSAPQQHVFSAQHIIPASSGAKQSPVISSPWPATSSPIGEEFHWSPQHSAKRVKLNSPRLDAPSPSDPVFAVPAHRIHAESPPSNLHPAVTFSNVMFTPATPGSRTNSASPYNPTSVPAYDPELRRMSVKSLLADPIDERNLLAPPGHAGRGQKYRTYGYDHGFVDLDIPRNNDNAVVLPRTPDMRRPSAIASEEASVSSQEPDNKQLAFEPGGYYADPVPIKIPRFLEPLPPELLENQMNLLYFHHFINHTGRILLPHDCPQNPFRTVFPQMAVRNTQLLHLMLAFSASHRARLLDHPEPVNRIAEWMSDVLPALRRALADPASPGEGEPTDPSSLAPLATAIMLASLEIISPSTFAVSIRWQDHLQIARQMIVSKGGLHHLAQKADGARDKAIFLLSRWFAYMDVLGALSGSKHEQPLWEAYWEDGGGLWLVNRADGEVDKIDCFYGFSGRCISLLAQVAELATQCDQQRIDPITNRVKMGWRPQEAVRQQAIELQARLSESASGVYQGCTHTDPQDDTPSTLTEEEIEGIIATNKAFHIAAIIHLQRRVLGLPSVHPDVQDSVQQIVQCLDDVRHGSSAENCLLFPIFTAGCEAQTDEEREIFMERIKSVEGWGIDSVKKARVLMQKSWDTGQPWETLVDGEFLG